MEPKNYQIRINPRGTRLCLGQYDRRRRMPAEWETADKDTKRQRAKPVDL